LVDRAKRALRLHYARDERLTAWQFFERFARLREDSELAVSLIYEEFCLLEEAGGHPDPDDFCRRYLQWSDSLEVQLKCHRELNGLPTRVQPSPLLPEPGDDWHGFRIKSILGRGGTSTVYLAQEYAMGGRSVVLKVSPDRGPEPAIVGCLDHPRIMPTFSVCHDTAQRLRGLCMPYRPGAPLGALLRRGWPLRNSHGALAFWTIPAAQRGSGPAPSHHLPGWLGFPSAGTYEHGVAWIVLAVAQAVTHIHSCGVIHCDIKPSNVYVADRDGPLLCDFGFARSHQAQDPVLGGTPAYMAPEQLRAFLDPRCWLEVGAGADIYALGLILGEMLLGIAPGVLPSRSARRAARELLNCRSHPDWAVRTFSGHTSTALLEIIVRCLRPSPRERYADADDFARDLAHFVPLSTTSSGGASIPRARSFDAKVRRQTMLEHLPNALDASPAAACSPILRPAV
jgi:serine/threonine protein kinase